ncbi:hypothetical protein G2W53_031507 [Senna tora]|uniref:Uncharacterized protein n=1 Tax=Senna tora TaxID=362788 RepID=A0A834T893_9FABA|nr:hypothetical protein G2W53_031507 [Senna tora]
MIAAIWKISPAALHVDDRAPPLFPFPFPLDATISAKHFSVLFGLPNEITLLWAFRPPNEFNPLILLLFAFTLDLITAPVTLAAERPQHTMQPKALHCRRRQSFTCGGTLRYSHRRGNIFKFKRTSTSFPAIPLWHSDSKSPPIAAIPLSFALPHDDHNENALLCFLFKFRCFIAFHFHYHPM